MAKKRRSDPHQFNSVAKLLQTQRREHGFTMQALAAEAKVTRTYLTAIMRSDTVPRLQTYNRICRALGIDDEDAISAYLESISDTEEWPALADYARASMSRDRDDRDSLTIDLSGLSGATRLDVESLLKHISLRLTKLLSGSGSLNAGRSHIEIDTRKSSIFKPYLEHKYLQYARIGSSRRRHEYVAGVFRISPRSVAMHKHCPKVYPSPGREIYMAIRGKGELYLECDASAKSRRKGKAAPKSRYSRFDVYPGVGGEYAGELCHVWVNQSDEPLDLMLTVIPFLVPRRMSTEERTRHDKWCIHPYTFALDDYEGTSIPDELKSALAGI